MLQPVSEDEFEEQTENHFNRMREALVDALKNDISIRNVS